MNQIFILLGRWGIVPLLRGGHPPQLKSKLETREGGGLGVFVFCEQPFKVGGIIYLP